jgi:hypothetical protein
MRVLVCIGMVPLGLLLGVLATLGAFIYPYFFWQETRENKS